MTQVAAVEGEVLGAPGHVTDAVARHLHKLLAYKDEYEVARLHLKEARRARPKALFVEPRRVIHLLHPPLLKRNRTARLALHRRRPGHRGSLRTGLNGAFLFRSNARTIAVGYAPPTGPAKTRWRYAIVTRTYRPAFDEVKFKELVLYFAQKCSEDPSFGRTKLNKLLFFTDFAAYARTGKPVTGATYFRLPYGPAPKQFKLVVDRMELKDLAFEIRDHFGREQARPVALRAPRLESFSAVEIAIANEAIDVLRDATATEVSRWSHDFPGWRIAAERGDIPYESVFLDQDRLPAAAFAHARDVVAAYDGWK